ncbi:MAG TPA: 1-deoxy-D-xylulose-5-phosphate reductoisomerase, partial [Dehalococcoidia bacterium]
MARLLSGAPATGLDHPIRIALLGSTGSIGRQTLDVIRSNPGRFDVVALAAGRNIELLAQQVREFSPAALCCADNDALHTLISELPAEDAPVASTLVEMATDPSVDVVISAIVGGEGLVPAMAALSAGKAVALANKEAMVMAGALVTEAAARGGGSIRPVDSEHSAIWQCLDGRDAATIRRLLITASGGALRDMAPSELGEVTPERALAHPTWLMGRRITIDSATLFNKGLEVIEARWLFDVPFERIDVVMHRE